MRLPVLLSGYPAARYVAPFVVFMGLLALMPRLAIEPRLSLTVWLAAGAASIVLFSTPALEFRPARPLASVLLGVAVCALWLAPDLLVPGWRSSVLFQNALTGELRSSLSAATLADPWVLALRSARAILIVPIAEELFWRGWLMRWIAAPKFDSLPLGHYDARAFWLVAIMFAMEHGPYWDVGLATGIVYNWWMTRTRRLSDLVLAHAVTNACLCGFVIATGRWEYWQ
jgi:CAAX prenyl protease-like protein